MSSGISRNGILWWYSDQNLSPRITENFLARQRRLLSPQQYRREHQNQWVDAADSFTSASEVDAAMGHGWTMQTQGRSGASYVMAVDLGLVTNPTVIGVAHEDRGVLYLDSLTTFQGSRERPVQLIDVELAILRLAQAFPTRSIQIESWQGVSAVQSLQRRGLPIAIFTPTARAHSEQWPCLSQRLASRSLVLPSHQQLRDELLNLTIELGPTGVKVVDPGQLHQDHAVVLRMLCAMLQPQPDRGATFAAILPNDDARPGWRDQYFR
jgi:hypothetical protein